MQLHEALEVGELAGAFAQALFVQHVALHEVLAQHLGSPLTEIGAAGRFYAVADRDDDVKVVVFCAVGFAIISS